MSNLLAGILLLIRQPFSSGDEIEVSGQRGTVEQITIRETQLKTYDGEKVLIPNAEVYQNVIRVQTAYGPKRTTLVIGLDDWEDLDRAADIALDAIRDIEGVETDPAPQAYFNSFGDSVTNMDLRFWTQPQQAEVRRVQDQVVRRVGRALKDAEIPMPSPITELDVRASVQDLLADVVGSARTKSDGGDDPLATVSAEDSEA
ncbi:MAG: mechanosensitive ion channel domain-containing protein [Ilumatobacter sp.]